MKKTICLILAVLVLAAALTGCGNPTDSFEKLVKKGEYTKAVEMYGKKIAGNSETETSAYLFLQNYLDEGLRGYIDGTLSEQEFNTRYATVEKVNNGLWIIPNLDTTQQEYLYYKQSKDSFKKGMEYLNQGNLEAAINAFYYVVPEDVQNYTTAREKLDEALTTFKTQAIEKAGQLMQEGRFEEAAAYIYEAENMVGYSDELENCLSEIYTRQYSERIAAAYASGDLVTVMLEYRNASENGYVLLSNEMTEQYQSAHSDYVSAAAADAEAAFGGDKKDYSAAIRVLQLAEADVTFDESVIAELDAGIDFYQTYTPIYLTELEYTQIARYICVGDAYGDDTKDVNGVKYDEATVICPAGDMLATEVAESDDEAYVLYNLNFEYSTLTGVLFRPYSSLSCASVWENPTIVRIYGDGALLYEAPNFTQETFDTIKVELDVTGVRNLKIVMRGVWTDTTGWPGLYDRLPKVCFGEIMLQK